MAIIESNRNVQEPGKQIDASVWHEAERREMAPLGIGFDGRYYRYEEYRYDLCSDAVNYARLDRSRRGCRTEHDVQPQWTAPGKPTEDERRVMADLGITFDGTHYRYLDYRYDRLPDAMNYARLKP